MNKSVIAILAVVLVAAGVAMPAGYFGEVAENTIRSQVAEMPDNYAMRVVDYQRGWFSSTARLEWELPEELTVLDLPGLPGLPGNGASDDDPAPESSGTGIAAALAALASAPTAVDIEIAHGPVFFAVGPGLGLFKARGRIELGSALGEGQADNPDQGAQHVNFQMSSFSGRTVNSRLDFERLDWQLGNMVMDFTEGWIGGQWAGAGEFQTQRLYLEEMNVRGGLFTGIHGSVKGLDIRTEYPQGLPSGSILAASEVSASVDDIRLATKQGSTVLRMTGLSSAQRTFPEEGELYRSVGRLKIDSLELGREQIGAGEMTHDIGGIGEAALSQLLAAPQEQTGVTLSPELQDGLRALLADGPYANFYAVFTHQGEPGLNLVMRTAVEPDRVPADTDAASIAGILASLDFVLDMEIREALAKELLGENALQTAIGLGALRQTETGYEMRVSFQDGELQQNGRVVPLPFPLPSPPEEAEPSPFEGVAPTPFEDDEPSPFDQV